MQDFVVLIMLFFSILATVLITLMAGLAMIVLLFIFSITAILVGAKQQSIFKGLKILIYSCSLIIVTPLSYLIFSTYVPQVLNISQNLIQPIALAIGLSLSIGFALVSYKTFEKIATIIYSKMSKKKQV